MTEPTPKTHRLPGAVAKAALGMALFVGTVLTVTNWSWISGNIFQSDDATLEIRPVAIGNEDFSDEDNLDENGIPRIRVGDQIRYQVRYTSSNSAHPLFAIRTMIRFLEGEVDTDDGDTKFLEVPEEKRMLICEPPTIVKEGSSYNGVGLDEDAAENFSRFTLLGSESNNNRGLIFLESVQPINELMSLADGEDSYYKDNAFVAEIVCTARKATEEGAPLEFKFLPSAENRNATRTTESSIRYWDREVGEDFDGDTGELFAAGNLIDDGSKLSKLVILPSSEDTDNDGWLDAWEMKYFGALTTIIADASSATGEDNDGLSFAEEHLYGTDPTNTDTDSDGTSDLAEINAGTNPLDATNTPADSDSDGLPDWWEAAIGKHLPGQPTKLDPAADEDSDGATNLEEFNAKTDPTNSDTDGDGVSDGDEIDAGTDPRDPTNKPLGALTATLIATNSEELKVSFSLGDESVKTLSLAADKTLATSDFTLKKGAASITISAVNFSNGAIVLKTSENLSPGSYSLTFNAGSLVAKGITAVTKSGDSTTLAASNFPSSVTTKVSKDIDDDGMPDAWEAAYCPNGECGSSADSDNDGLSDIYECYGRISSRSVVSECANSGTGWSDPSQKDTDEDGLTDKMEFDFGSDPRKADTDADGLSDKQEFDGWKVIWKNNGGETLCATNSVFTTCDDETCSKENCISVKPDPTKADTDGDGVSDADEMVAGTHPEKADTDGDGVNDKDDSDSLDGTVSGGVQGDLGGMFGPTPDGSVDIFDFNVLINYYSAFNNQ